MSLLQDLRKQLDDYFDFNPATDGYDEVDAVFELADTLDDAQLLQIIQEAGLWGDLLDERIVSSDRVSEVRDIVVDIVAAELAV